MDDPISPGSDVLNAENPDSEGDGGSSSLSEFTWVLIFNPGFLLSNIELIIRDVITVPAITAALPAGWTIEEAIFVPAYIAVPVVKASATVSITVFVVGLNSILCFKPSFAIYLKNLK